MARLRVRGLGYSDKNITKFSIEQLQELLQDNDIDFEDGADKYELQALWPLWRLDHIDRREDLLDGLGRFWSLTVKEQGAELGEAGLSTKGTKWEHVKTFVEAQFVSQIQ
jgi:hypothetical protein